MAARPRDPELFARVRAAVAAGRWIPVGGTWIEPDCNLPSGESLARQFLYGQRFFERELGRRCTEFWNPDVFGYTAQLPQLMREAGITRFLTQKLSWNRFTQPEHHTFTWQGLDGSEVLTHFPPADTYNAEATVEELWRESAGYKDHGRSHHSLLVFGHGDGGGGPTDAMLERLARARDIHGLPPTTIRSPVEFFDDLEADATDLRTVVGELYFELHRGTYTSQAQVKRGNRRGEGALHDAELLAALAGSEYPREELRGCGRRCCSTSSTTSCPGSSIREVNVRAAADLAEVEAGADAISARGARRGRRPVQHARVRAPRGGRARRRARVRRRAAVRGGCDRRGRGRACASRAATTAPSSSPTSISPRSIAPDGTVTSLVAGGREALSAPANRFELYEDLPTAWDAWDVDPAHLETREDVAPADGLARSTSTRCAPRWSSSAGGSRSASGSTRARGGSSSSPTSTGASTTAS